MQAKCIHELCYCEVTKDHCCGAQCREAVSTGKAGPTCECGHIDCEEATMREGGVHPTSADDV